ncbi:hypothetical protein [Fodinibius saliphilus]|uniref:hypothetical protein n=1 Tax=Fodinibius saliphilus TaxID=1920650 RepID=UPI0011098DF2|nr:hypothetical protein [Fodinibius saliphilus]
MKNVLSPLIQFATIITFSFQKAKVYADVGVGVNYGTINERPNNLDPSNRTGSMLGEYLNVKGPMIPVSIQPEVLYSQMV